MEIGIKPTTNPLVRLPTRPTNPLTISQYVSIDFVGLRRCGTCKWFVGQVSGLRNRKFTTILYMSSNLDAIYI